MNINFIVCHNNNLFHIGYWWANHLFELARVRERGMKVARTCAPASARLSLQAMTLSRAVRYGQKIYITIFWFFFSISILITILTQTDMLYLTHLVFAHLTCFCTSYLFLHILLVLHILFCTFPYSITHFTLYFFSFLPIYMLLVLLLYNFYSLHCPLSGPDLI